MVPSYYIFGNLFCHPLPPISVPTWIWTHSQCHYGCTYIGMSILEDCDPFRFYSQVCMRASLPRSIAAVSIELIHCSKGLFISTQLQQHTHFSVCWAKRGSSPDLGLLSAALIEINDENSMLLLRCLLWLFKVSYALTYSETLAAKALLLQENWQCHKQACVMTDTWLHLNSPVITGFSYLALCGTFECMHCIFWVLNENLLQCGKGVKSPEISLCRYTLYHTK